MPKSFPISLNGFALREPEDDIERRIVADVQEHGWHIVAVQEDADGPGFAYTIGLFLRTLQPEILIMGVPPDPSGRVLNAIGEFLMEGGQIYCDEPCSGFVDGRDVQFRPVHRNHYREYLGCANWFYRPHPGGFPALQCIWPDLNGVFPDEAGFDESFRRLQVDLSDP